MQHIWTLFLTKSTDFSERSPNEIHVDEMENIQVLFTYHFHSKKKSQKPKVISYEDFKH